MTTRPRRWRLRYSLRTLLLSTLLAGAVMGLWRGWEPWALRWFAHDANLQAAHFSPDGKWLLSFVEGKCFVRAMPGATLVRTLPCDDTAMAWSADNVLLALSNKSGTEIWAAPNWKRAQRLENCRANGAVFSPDSKLMVTLAPIGDFGSKVNLWNIDTAARIAEFGLEYRFNCFSSNSRHLVLEGAEGKFVAVVNATNGAPLWTLNASLGDIIDDIRFTNSDAQLIIKSSRVVIEDSGIFEDAFVRKYETLTGTLISTSEQRRDGWTGSGGFGLVTGFRPRVSIDGRKLEKDELDYLKLTDASGKFLGRLPDFQLADSRGQAEFSPDGRSILAANYRSESELYLWTRQHPEYWWGLACLPAFWMTVVFAAVVLWSFIRDLLGGAAPSRPKP